MNSKNVTHEAVCVFRSAFIEYIACLTDSLQVFINHMFIFTFDEKMNKMTETKGTNQRVKNSTDNFILERFKLSVF